MQQPNDRGTGSRNPGATRPNTQSHAVRHTQRPQATYRARPSASAPPPPAAPDLLSQRAAAHQAGEARKRRVRMALFLAIGLLAAGAIAAYAYIWTPVTQTVTQIQQTVKDVFVTPVPVRPAPSSSGPHATPVPVIYPDWSKKEPINILLLGLDYRPQDADSRSDTMIVVHIDPANKTAAMVSIPRDLYVDIPGHGQDRINAAFQDGEDDTTTPGGGPGLAMATVEYNLGIKIHYFAQVDFTGFERIVDTMGGITIDVPKPLADNEYPLTSYNNKVNYGTTRIYIPAGLQHMDGKTALRYARSRHADSDIGRNSRQQQVLFAIRQQGLSLNMLSHLNDILTQLSGAVRTDLTLTQVGSLAQLAREIHSDSIQSLLIDNNMVQETMLPSGADVLVPQWELIRPKIQQLFADPALAKEDARLSVQNGTTVGGTARKLSEELSANGFSVADLSSASDQGSYPKTEIIDFTGGQKPHTIAVLAQKLGLDPASVKQEDASKAIIANSDGKPVDILVIAGDDQLSTSR